MSNYILKRFLSIIPVLIIVAIIVFSITFITPGDPATYILGPDASPDNIEKLREEMGLNQPFFQQFFAWIGSMFQGDLGMSVFLNKPVLDVVISYLSPTILLALLSEAIAIIIALILGVVASVKRNTVVDQGVMGFALLGLSTPSFLLGLLLVLVFSVQLNWFPTSGYMPLSEGLLNHLRYLILPAISLGFIQAALITRITRSSMLDVLPLEYIKTAKAKGLSRKSVIFKHALRNAFIPILEVIGQSLTTLLAGAAVIEIVFNIPGIGQLLVNSIERRDFPVIQGTVLIIAGGYVFMNLIIDLLYGIFDPRVRINRK